MDAPVQYTVLAEIPATNPADAHSTKKFGLHQPRPLQTLPRQLQAALATTATTPRHLARHAFDGLCTAKIPWSAPTTAIISGGAPPPPLPSGVVL
jgi:hypothetical protein